MKWKDKLEEWENGIPQTYPERIHDGFFYETYKCDNKMENTYKQKFIPSKKLRNVIAGFTARKMKKAQDI